MVLTTYNFDALLERVGAMGKFQYIVMAMNYSYWCVIGMIYISIVFLGATPPYECSSTPDKSNKCSNTSIEEKTCYESNLTTYGNVSSDAKYCTNGYVYDCSTWEHTITIDWDLVCDRRTLNSIATFCFFGGLLAASMIGGILSDKYGRRTIGTIAVVGSFIFNVALALSPNFLWFCVFRFMVPLFTQMTILCSHLYLLELTNRNWRTFIGVTSNTSYGIGITLLPAVAYILRNWRHLQLALACCLPPFAFVFYFLPESPRWLLAYHHHDTGKKALNVIAKRNKVDIITDTEWTKYEEKEKSLKENHKHMRDLLNYPTLIKIFVNTAFIWIVCSLVFYGLTLNAGILSGNIFVNTALIGIMDVGGCAISVPLIKFFGSRKFVSMTFLVAGSSILLSIFQVAGWVSFGTVFALVGKFAISGTSASMYLFVPELFPTDIRTTALGFSSGSARIGGMLTPFALQLQETVAWATPVIFATLTLVAAALCMLLPETHNKPMLTNVAEAEEIYSKRKVQKSYTEEDTKFLESKKTVV